MYNMATRPHAHIHTHIAHTNTPSLASIQYIGRYCMSFDTIKLIQSNESYIYRFVLKSHVAVL